VPCAFAAGLLIIALAGVLVAADSRRQPPPSASAAHYAVLARAVLTAERNPKAHSEALALLEKALALNSNNVPALLGYARVLTVDVLERWAPPDEARARLALAEKALACAGRLEPANARVHHQRGSMLRARGDWEGAAQAYERALAMNPNNAWAIAELGRAKMELGARPRPSPTSRGRSGCSPPTSDATSVTFGLARPRCTSAMVLAHSTGC
jgi:tetratricopeptide (TPR) repeat protein